jgi:hypothetical protein
MDEAAAPIPLGAADALHVEDAREDYFYMDEVDEAAAPIPLGAADALHDPAPQTPEAPRQPFSAPTSSIEDGIETMGFLYEEPTSSYWETKSKLDGLGAFSHERWGSMECIHFILPNMTSHGQAATPKQANLPHYQTSLEHIKSQIASFRESGGQIRFQVYEPDQNYSNKFLHVTNIGLPSIAMLDWDYLARKANTQKKGDKKRQHKFRDFGTTSGQCTTRVDSEIGIGKPRKKPGTNDRGVVEAMLALSEYTRAAEFKWLPRGTRPFNCDDPNDPRNEFATRFHKDCIIPAVRVGLTNVDHPCRYHCDEMNSSLLQYEMVPTLVMIVTIDGIRYRCAIIGYSRRSVDEYLVRAGEHVDYVNFVCEEYNAFEEERKILSPSLFTQGQPVSQCIPRFAVLKNPCNLDPWGHYSSVIEATLQLDLRFKLNLPERLSLLRAMAVTPNSAYLFVAAASTLLQIPRLNPKHRRNYRFGLLVANLMVDIHRTLEKEKRKLPPRRFNCYAAYSVPLEKEWSHQCDRLLLLHFTTPNTKLKAERRAAYREVRHALADIFPYVDVLGGNHLVAIAGTLGLLPLWVTTEIEIHKGRSITWLLTKFFTDKVERAKHKVDDVILNITAALKTRFVGNFSRRTVENIACKIFRRHTKSQSDDRFFDILLPKQHLYSVHKLTIRCMSWDGKVTHSTKQTLLSTVPFGGTYITLKELHSKVPNTWPGWEPKVSGLGREFLDGLFDNRRGPRPEFALELNPTVTRNTWLLERFISTEKRMLR